jgi:hypothetical protein
MKEKRSWILLCEFDPVFSFWHIANMHKYVNKICRIIHKITTDYLTNELNASNISTKQRNLITPKSLVDKASDRRFFALLNRLANPDKEREDRL